MNKKKRERVMPLKNYKSVTPSRRNAVGLIYNDITSKKPYKALIRPLKKTGGRNNQGKITTRHIGGGNKRQYRVIDFKRNKDNIIGNISSIEYDPNRNARICLVNYADGEKRYILAPEGIKIGDQIESGNKVKMTIGNAMELDNIANGAFIHNIELNPGQGGKICRSAGTYAQILGKEGKYVIVRLISGETRKILGSCRATVGAVGNKEFNLAKKGKAGKSRYEGIRPTVRGSAMNPVDHSHGGGEGRCPVGKDAPRTPWGRKALGVKTRNNRKRSTKLIIMRRMRKMRKR